ncbi:DNA repair protein RecN (Recombination protein N) [Kribbella orskensis]|uniref:DNA repair protein RecN n=1 Tax=Kribbella orskensis TaxID=2512216 RepID=A0ABY2B957_9ACTN|nr:MULTISPECIES: DNA repair protein RecN [Kribbella]TCN31596.1 DNA repair protein RecN (Recombination protein N) [Kribbella sp. VKM Ac-2500]TCO11941.1 DNA repair protein RecN (Recombination protein N) [Kribbella orskensis]
MLAEIRITGLGVIEDATLELDPGFTAVTGETGAGKTMVVTGVNMLLGGRADSGLVRHGVRRARVEGRATAVPRSIVQQAEDRGGELDDDELLIARELSSEGRSRAFLGGASVPVSVLAEVSGDLVAIHGQADQWRLLQPARQRETLDTFAGKPVLVPLGEYTAAYRRHREVEAELIDLTTRERDRLAEADLLRFGLEEIAKLEPLPGEDVELAAEEERLAYADGLRTAATSAADALASDDLDSNRPSDVLGLLQLAKQVLDGEREHDAKLAELADRASELGYLAADLAGELSSYAADVDTDPARLSVVSERRSVLTGLVRKYGADEGTVDEVLEWSKRSAQRLAEIEGSDERVEQLTAEQTELQAQLKDLGEQVSAARKEAAARLGVAVSEELSGLAMPHATLTVEVHETAAGPFGADEVEFCFAANPGSPARPLQKAASGGELSRVMLALEVILSDTHPVPTLVFDEIDAGIGGRAAVEVGKRLARLAEKAQVIVVTHLPQVAAFADRHAVVLKSDDGSVTTSGLVALDDDARLKELSRMMAGLENSDAAQAHAEELLALAAERHTKPRKKKR